MRERIEMTTTKTAAAVSRIAPGLIRTARKVHLAVMLAAFALLFCPSAAYASASGDIFDKFKTIAKDVYLGLLGISTIIAVTGVALALIIRMMSRNQRAVDEATAWIKRILISWIILNCLGLIVTYLSGFFGSDTQWTPS